MSHVRGLSDILTQLLPTGHTASSFFQPGGGFQAVAEAHLNSPDLVNPGSEDSVFVICGTNDIGSTEWAIVQKALDDILHKFRDTNLCFVGVPLRFIKKKLNFHVARFNCKIKTYVKSKSNTVHYLDPNRFLASRDYARDGIHLNKGGKSKFCNRINNVISGLKPSSSVATQQTVINNVRLNNDTFVCQNLIDLEDLNEPLHIESKSRVIPQSTMLNVSFAHESFNLSNVPAPTLLDTPNGPDYSSCLVRNETNYLFNFYRLAHNISNKSPLVMNHSSPLPNPIISKNHILNFPALSQETKT